MLSERMVHILEKTLSPTYSTLTGGQHAGGNAVQEAARGAHGREAIAARLSSFDRVDRDLTCIFDTLAGLSAEQVISLTWKDLIHSLSSASTDQAYIYTCVFTLFGALLRAYVLLVFDWAV